MPILKKVCFCTAEDVVKTEIRFECQYNMKNGVDPNILFHYGYKKVLFDSVNLTSTYRSSKINVSWWQFIQALITK